VGIIFKGFLVGKNINPLGNTVIKVDDFQQEHEEKEGSSIRER